MYFVSRKIDVTFIGPETVKLTNHRTTARIRTSGDPAIGTCELQIWGMSQSYMNQLTTFAKAFMTPNYNYQVRIEAGDEVNGMNVVFFGTIQQAWADYDAMPNVPFHVLAFSAPPVTSDPSGQNWNSYEGPTDVPQMLSNLAGKMGMQFENAGVNVKLTNPYHFGSWLRQAQTIRQAADINMVFENGVMAIWPLGKTRGDASGVISKDTGMRTSPKFSDYGVVVTCEFRKPYKYGTAVTIKSQVTQANGQWEIKQLDYDLASLVPRGNWFTTIYGIKLGTSVPFVPSIA
ncbi:MAG TPA: hypothetical protein VIU44_08135 [Gaiellaceae bacterium]